MNTKVSNYVKENNMLEAQDYVVVGVSGGADSVCLLYVLMELQKSIDFTLHVVHVNHKIRKEAGEDAAYVESICKQCGLPFTLIEADVEKIAKERKQSTEEAGREVRYQAFEDVLNQYAKQRQGKIAIAHNQNDCCETFLFHVFRGSGLKGMAGILPVRDKIIRPLLCVQRAEIEAYLQQRKIPYCIDSTNLEDAYTRNKIRHHILPVAVEEISAGAIAHISQACEKIAQANDYIESQVQKTYEESVRKTRDGLELLEVQWRNLHPMLQKELIMRILHEVASSRRDLEQIHVEQVAGLMDKQCGRQVDLPYQMCAVRTYDGIYIGQGRSQAQAESVEYVLTRQQLEELERGNTIEVPINDINSIQFRLITHKSMENIMQKSYTKWIDYDKIKFNPVVRTRKTGDYLTIDDCNRKKSLKDYMINEKIPRQQRDLMLLVADDRHVIWLIGGRLSSYYKVSSRTKRILEVKYIGGVGNGRTD